MITNRREFIQTACLGTAALWGGAALAEARNQLANVGIIGGVPPDAGGDWKASLKRMAGFGYTELESRARGESVPEFLAFLRELKIKPVACGVDFGRKLKPDWLEMARKMGVPYAVTYWPWFHPLETMTLEQLKEIAEQLNRCGEDCARAGLRMAFHNHDRELRLLEGKPIFDRLIELTDPKLVTVQMDLYWIIKGGGDPVDYFKRYPGRFEMFHVKDMGPAPEGKFVAVGAGTIDFARIFAQSKLAGVKHYIVELEKEANTTANAQSSCAYLKQLRF